MVTASSRAAAGRGASGCSRRTRHGQAAAVLALALALPSVATAQGAVTEDVLALASGDWSVQVGSPETGRTVTLPIEVYVARVLAGEGDPNAPEAAHEALAVAIRTFAAANETRHEHEGFQVCDETHCQVLRESTDRSRSVALATAGAVLLHDGVPAELFYSASCGGRSERAADLWSGIDFPYLQSTIDDVHGDDEPWTVDLSLQQIQQALRRVGFAGTRLRDVQIDSRNVSERVSYLRVDGMRPAVIAGDQFRLAVGPTVLRSTAFTMARRGSGFRFTGRGYGHGVGMCVIGAGRRAARGETYSEILAQYYPGLELGSVTGGFVLTETPAAEPVLTRPALGAIAVHLPAVSPVSAIELETLVATARDELSEALGLAEAPPGVTLDLHETLDEFWLATGQPWWTTVVVRGATVHLAPFAVLSQRDGLDLTVRVALGRMLVSNSLLDRPVWVRVGAARHFARATLGAPGITVIQADCPSDAELTLAISAAALRAAEARAEACFVYALGRTADWRDVR
jgi:SpoIID/LytB domain protein